MGLRSERDSTTFHILRKPDFQRETANWSPEKVAEMVFSFVEGDLIPSIIVWRSPTSGKVFVIDGAHRLSALIAWINDDYGDETLSRELFGDLVNDTQQKKIAKKTRDLVLSKVGGTYGRLKEYVISPQGAPTEEVLVRARNAASLSFTLQDVHGDVAKAERSFLRINQSATPIDPTEFMLIQSRRKSNAIAARALMHAGEGHAYWGAFEEAAQKRVKAVAAEAYEDLFKPILEYPIRTVQLPAGGLALTSDSLDLVFNLINHLNAVVDASTKKTPGVWRYPGGPNKTQIDLPDETDGTLTIRFLQAVKQATKAVFGPGAGSLAMHPGVYCYGATGRFLPTAFFAAIGFVQWLELHRKFDQFTSVRKQFEDFLVSYRYFINQIAGVLGSQLKGLPATVKMYRIIFEHVGNDAEQKIIDAIIADPELSFIRTQTADDQRYGRNFSRETSSAIYLREALAKELTCGICGARIRAKTITLDHVDRKQDGGTGAPENGQLAHPYCNDGYKEKLAHAKVATS